MTSVLQDKVAVITGGTAGIGKAIARAFLDEGALVVISGRSAESGEKALAELGAGDRARFVSADVTSRADLDRLIDAAQAWQGRLDITVLNAGGVGKSSQIAVMDDDEWELELNLNLTHTFRGIRRSLKYMLEQRSGRILCMSSVEGKRGRPGIGGYAANKAAITTLTRSVSQEVGTEGVTVNSLCPGLVVTDQVNDRAGKGQGMSGVDEVVASYSREAAIKRPVLPEEVAAAAVFLASDAASGITGQAISIDGGTSQH
ncbi:SDR family NAD(P)-dependent oxidoreductase [Gordonia mangrovi]|uniref:SDR family NAD(P)-dependent oxidoreductase n=1 Tax=Gordonia mangrovi TaxID=2665643 RepID=UPI0021AC24F3|nr:SDR family NAD(P)-dependent oxidoreductase [Gordonia mangrovi]UVF79363.1 SDR family oxidoreductase [Gordonia mangrovi]